VYGLYGAFVPVLIYSLFGSSKQLGVGPVAVTSLLIANGMQSMVEFSSWLDPANPPLNEMTARVQETYNTKVRSTLTCPHAHMLSWLFTHGCWAACCLAAFLPRRLIRSSSSRLWSHASTRVLACCAWAGLCASSRTRSSPASRRVPHSSSRPARWGVPHCAHCRPATPMPAICSTFAGSRIGV
jgi:hypothetical protein